MNRIGIVTLVFLLCLVGVAGPQATSAETTQATPITGKTFATVPDAVELSFDPSVDLQTIHLVVIAPNGARADDGTSRTTATAVRSTILRSGLGDGDYLVYWLAYGAPGKRAEQFGQLAFTVSGSPACQPSSNATPRPPAETCLADPPSGAPGERLSSDGISVTLQISSEKAGPVDLSATVTDTAGAPIEGATVWFRARHLEMNHGELPYLAAPAGAGIYQASGVGMGMGGSWRVAVDVILPDQLPITVFVDQTMVE